MAEPPPTTTATTTKLDLVGKPPPKTTITPWGTLEDLLLTCAVNRHGTNSWTSISNELNNHRRTSLFTPHLCRLKFLDLQRRFSDTADAAVLLDELRRLRVAELKRDLHRYDVSIVSLQLKVKRLKEEREKSVTKDVDEIITTKHDGFDERENSDLIKNDAVETPPPENGELFVESNSVNRKTEPVEIEPARVVGPVRGVESCNGSSNSKESERVDSGELGESASDVQSTASLRRREKEMREVCGNSSSGEENQSLVSKSSGGVGDSGCGDKEGEGGGGSGGGECKSQRLVEFLNVVRTRTCGSVFEGRLESQYKSLIKEHIDLGIIRKRVEDGLYSNCHTMFYRDLMLLVNNAIVFFSRTSSEHKFAVELRQLVTQHFQTHLSIRKGQTLTPTPPIAPSKPTKFEVDQTDRSDLKPKLAITGPVIACRKRSSIAGKLLSEAVKKESSPATVKPASSDVLKKEGDKSLSTSLNAVSKKQTRDQSSASRNPTSKNQNSNSSPTRKPSPRTVSAELKKSSSRNSKQGSRPGNDLLLDVLDNAVKRKIFGNGSSSGNGRGDRQKDQGRGSLSGLNKKPSTEKEKGKEERESSRNKNNGRPPKKAATAVVVSGKRGRDGGRDSDAHTKKRQRR
ncbi:hypothetical protein RND81_12G040000 [Saponaria officinalis]|uniref:Bromo domain-containing protein n=1 Tax=Saponaria officinalis TaxID=3572 RepID=A0AAW1H6N7_SAPOF